MITEILETKSALMKSEVSIVRNHPMSVNYNVESLLFDKEVMTKAYVSKMSVSLDGWIDFNITRKEGPGRHVQKPFHLLTTTKLLCAFKIHKHENMDCFALNHELFSLEWDACIILHFIDKRPFVFIASRAEWIRDGNAYCQGEELQVFLKNPDYRKLPLSLLPSYLDSWLKDCLGMVKER